MYQLFSIQPSYQLSFHKFIQLTTRPDKVRHQLQWCITPLNKALGIEVGGVLENGRKMRKMGLKRVGVKIKCLVHENPLNMGRFF